MKKLSEYIHVLVFAVVFALVGYFVPLLYRQYYDAVNYFEVRQPVDVIKSEFSACEKVEILLTYKTLSDIEVKYTVNLNIVENGSFHTVETTQAKPVHLEKTDDYVTVKDMKQLPCLLNTGYYFYNIVGVYKANGVQRNYTFNTETFYVK